ncbi:MAG: DUF4215 domain-containing protein, partial [Candidatus Binatia bacterium]
MSRPKTLVALSLLCSITLAAPALAVVTPEQKCASAKMKVVGKLFGAKAKCYAKALSQSAAVVVECLEKAEDKFTGAFTKADLGACLHDGDAATIQGKLDGALNDVVGDIGCGNGQLEGDEACDDGNGVDGDGCSSLCTVENLCGNGVIDSADLCDDGNNNAGDGCSESCLIETGYGCSGVPSACTSICGDGLIVGAESCDDTGVADGDGCSSSCTVEGGYGC